MYNQLEITVDKETLIKLAEEFGLPTIERDSITVVGIEKLLIFKQAEDTQWKLTEIC